MPRSLFWSTGQKELKLQSSENAPNNVDPSIPMFSLYITGQHDGKHYISCVRNRMNFMRANKTKRHTQCKSARFRPELAQCQYAVKI